MTFEIGVGAALVTICIGLAAWALNRVYSLSVEVAEARGEAKEREKQSNQRIAEMKSESEKTERRLKENLESRIADLKSQYKEGLERIEGECVRTHTAVNALHKRLDTFLNNQSQG